MEIQLPDMRICVLLLRMRSSIAERLPLAVWSSLRMELIWAYEGAPFEHVHEGVEYPNLVAWLVEAGSVMVRGHLSGRRTATADQWIFPAADKNLHRYSEDARVLSVRLKLHWPNDQPLFDAGQSVVIAAPAFPRLRSAARRLVREATLAAGDKERKLTEMLHVQMPITSHLRLRQRLDNWVEAYVEAMMRSGVPMNPVQRSDARVEQVRTLIEAAPLNRPLKELTLARAMKLSVSQLNRLFVEATGSTPRSYADRRRFDAARSALLGSAVSVKQVAFALGFNQPSHFSAWFRKKTGLYPTQFRDARADTTRVLG